MQELKNEEFKNLISAKLKGSDVNVVQNFDVKRMPLIKGKQCLYILDWKQSKIKFSRGVEEMLGYEADEFTMDLALSFFHPEDEKFVSRIVKGVVHHTVRCSNGIRQPFLNLTYRLRKKDGTYLKVLRQASICEIDNKGRLVSNFSILTDISFINNNDKVEWELFANELDVDLFNASVRKEFANFFTPRETNIIKLVLAGNTSRQIAEELFISAHTVSSHRKNILKKSRCSNVSELRSFCLKNGII